MSMRSFTYAQLLEELERLGFEPTAEETRTSQLWRDKASGKPVMVPRPPQMSAEALIPGCVLDRILEGVDRLYDPQVVAAAGEEVAKRQYELKKQVSPIEAALDGDVREPL
jgi:hypothetical protein